MTEIDISNYRGSLYIREFNDKYFWAIECDLEDTKEWDWKEITKSLYDRIMIHQLLP